MSPIFTDIRKLLEIPGAGTTARAFALQYLAPLVRRDMNVYDELKSTIFGEVAV